MRFPRERFEAFCRSLTLNSKEQGRVRFRWNGSQRRFVNELEAGLEGGIHKFVVLKARQLGITTACLALDLYWLFAYRGTQGALAVPSESVRDLSRNILEGYLQSLPRAMRREPGISNRTEIRFSNASRLAHLIAGGRNSGALARGQGLSFLHASEMSSWNDDEGVVSLEASLAEHNPERLYVLESTARGFNVFHDMWQDACRSKTTRAVFIGWWANDEYRMARSSPLYATYGRERLTREERSWANAVKKQYGVDIDPEQWAWWRWKWSEKDGSRLLLAEFPFTADQAFVMSGSEFFPIERLQQIYVVAEKVKRQCWNYVLGTRFEDTRIEADPLGALSVWEEPDPNASYVLAADPAYGESEWGDSFCVQVLKCTVAGAEQVAEFNTPDCTMYGFAWVLAHLAGAYSTPQRPPTVILELGGPGRGVLQELQRMPGQYADKVAGLSSGARAKLADIFGSIQHFLYRRPDVLSGSRLLQWETTFKTKQVMMNLLRDLLARGMLKINGTEWVDEARYVTQNGSSIQSEGRTHKDDRVIAMALACIAWQEQLMPQLLSAAGDRDYGQPGAHDLVGRSVAHWLDEVKRTQEDRRWDN